MSNDLAGEWRDIEGDRVVTKSLSENREHIPALPCDIASGSQKDTQKAHT